MSPNKWLVLSLLLLASTYTVAHAKAPDNSECKTCIKQASLLFSSGKNEQAADLLRSWSKRCSGNSQIHLLLSTILIRLNGHNEEAAQEAAIAVTIDPASIAAHLQYALALSNQDHKLHASQEFEKVTNLDPSNYEAWSSLSKLYAQLHENDKAKSCAEKAAEFEPSTATARANLLRNIERKNKTTEEKIDD